MAIDRKYNNLTRKSVVIPAYSVATVEYNDSMPNYYRVMNMGDGKLYCGTSAIPTTHRFEFSVGPQKIKLYTEPSRRNNLYIYNPSGVDVGCQIISFEAEFDPATLALSDLEIDMQGQTVQSESVITGFNQALPAGTNKIGKVDIATALPAGSNKIGNVGISGAIPAGTNNIGKVSVSNFPTDYAKEVNQKDYTEALSNILAAVGVKESYTEFAEGTAGDKDSYTAPDGYKLSEICFFSNDGEADIVLGIQNIHGTEKTITVKSGETLKNILVNTAFLSFAGAGNYRLCYRITEI